MDGHGINDSYFNIEALVFEIYLQLARRRQPNAAVDNFAAVKNQIAVGSVMADRSGSLSERVDVVPFHDKQRDVTAIASHPDPRRTARG